jgi:hypothetical protein
MRCTWEEFILISEALRRLSKFPLLVMIPIAVDALLVLLGMALHGFAGSSHVTFKFALQMGLPSISAVTEQRVMPGAVQLGGAGGFSGSGLLGVLMYLAVYLAIQSFLQGGYIGLLYGAANGRRLAMGHFAACGSRFFVRFLLLNILVLAFLFSLGGLATIALKMLGGILFILVFLLLRVLFLFLEFTIVAEDCSILEAFYRSRDAFRRRTPLTLPLVAAAVVVNVVAGLLVNALWHPFFFLILLVVYDIVGAGLQLAFMNEYRHIR